METEENENSREQKQISESNENNLKSENIDNLNIDNDNKEDENNLAEQSEKSLEEVEEDENEEQKPKELAEIPDFEDESSPVSDDNENKLDNDNNKINESDQNDNKEKQKNDELSNNENEEENIKNNDDETCNNDSRQHVSFDNSDLLNEQSHPAYTIDEINAAYNELLNDKKIPEKRMLPYLLQKINHEKMDAIDNQNYDLAKQLEELTTLINHEIENASYEAAQDAQKKYLNERESTLKQKLYDAETKYNNRLQKHKETIESKLKQLEEKHQQEINELKAKYQDPNFLNRFNKPSQQLVKLRKNEHQLAHDKNYNEARKVKKLADALQKKEQQEMQKIVYKSMQNEYIKLIDHHDQEKNRLIEFEKRMKDDIQAAKSKEITPIQQAIKQTTVRKSLNENRPNSSFSKTYNPLLARGSTIKSQNIVTPRTLLKMKNMRNKTIVDLKVKPVNNSAFSKVEQINQRMNRSKLPKL